MTDSLNDLRDKLVLLKEQAGREMDYGSNSNTIQNAYIIAGEALPLLDSVIRQHQAAHGDVSSLADAIAQAWYKMPSEKFPFGENVKHWAEIAAIAAMNIGDVNDKHVVEMPEAIEKHDIHSEISVLTPRSNSLSDLLDALEIHLVDYPTPENIHMQRKYLSDIRHHHLKPVVVSLEKCWKAILLEDGGVDMKQVAKAVLDSLKEQGVEVTYVD